MIRQLAADRHAGAADRANQISAIRQFTHLQLLAKSQIAKPLAAGSAQHANLHVTPHLGLVQGHGAVDFQIACEIVYHPLSRSPIETGLQQENPSFRIKIRHSHPKNGEKSLRDSFSQTIVSRGKPRRLGELPREIVAVIETNLEGDFRDSLVRVSQ